MGGLVLLRFYRIADVMVLLGVFTAAVHGPARTSTDPVCHEKTVKILSVVAIRA